MVSYRYMTIKKQTTWADEDITTGTDYGMDIVSASISPDQSVVNRDGVVSRGTKMHRLGNYKLSGGIESVVDDLCFGHMLWGTLGNQDTVVAQIDATDAYEHAFWGDTKDDLPFYSIALGYDATTAAGRERKINSVLFNSLTINMTAGELITWSADIVAGGEDWANAAAAPLFSDQTDVFDGHHIKIFLNGDPVTGSDVDASAVTVTINNNIKDDLFYLSSRFLGGRIVGSDPAGTWPRVTAAVHQPRAQKREITGSVDIPFEDAAALTEYKRFLGDTAGTSPVDCLTAGSQMEMYIIAQGCGVAGTSTTPPYLWMYFPEVVYTSADLSMSGRDSVVLTLNWKAYVKDVSAETNPPDDDQGDGPLSATERPYWGDHTTAPNVAGNDLTDGIFALVNDKNALYS